MEKNRGTVIAVIAALVVSVISLGVAFATFSRSLTINGNATIAASTWDVHFSTTSGGAAASNTVIANSATPVPTSETGTLDAYTFDFDVAFQQPGEKVKYEFYIVNAGTYNANLSAPTVDSPVCSISGVTQGSCPVTYTVTKQDGTAFSGNDTLNAGASVKVVVEAQLNYPSEMGDSNYTVANAISVSFPTVTFAYSQATGS